jgi:hypothetical protein
MLRGGYHPIVFCRFIATAKYLEAWLPRILGRDHPGLRVVAVTGEIGDEERREKVDELVRDPVRVLVATDCLSKERETKQYGEYRTKRLALKAWNRLRSAAIV